MDVLVEEIVTAVAKGDSVTLVGFGTFKSAARARRGKSPKTGEKINIAATTVPKFSAGATFKQKVAGQAKSKPSGLCRHQTRPGSNNQRSFSFPCIDGQYKAKFNE